MNIQEILGYLLGTSSKLVKRTMDNNLSKYNITTSQWAILKLLDTKGQLTQTQIANELMSDKATAGDVILRLAEKEYIEKLSDKSDRRVYVVNLTPKAKSVIAEIEKMSDDVTKKALKGLNDNDIEVFYKSLNMVISNLSQEE